MVVQTRHSRLLRLAFIPVWALLFTLLVACTDDEATGAPDRRPIPLPVGGVNRQNCETIALTDYFLSDDEKTWYTQNCNRLDCAEIRGTEYLTPQERDWYLEKCR